MQTRIVRVAVHMRCKKHSGIMGACASDAALDSSCSVAVILSLAGTDIVEYATCRSALVSDNARYMHSRTCHSQSKNISPLFVTELTVKTMRRYSLGFCEPQGKCNCIRERNGLSGSISFRFMSTRRLSSPFVSLLPSCFRSFAFPFALYRRVVEEKKTTRKKAKKNPINLWLAS